MIKTLAVLAIAVPLCAQPRERVKTLRIQVLSTMLADTAGFGEWGFAALVEVDGKRILFDTGAHPETVLNNARDLRVDLSTLTDVILSHNHLDHTAGLMRLRRAMMATKPEALSRVHVGKGMFLSRPTPKGEGNAVIRMRPEYESTGGKFIEHDKPVELQPGVWLTGPVSRIHDERNFGIGQRRLQTASGLVEDNVPEDMSMVFDTDAGLVVLSGCGHAGIVNTIAHARRVVREASVLAALGGFHLFALDDEKLNWTADRLKDFGLKSFLGAHCTGIEATYRIRQRAGLDRRSCSVAAVGATFELGKGLSPGNLAR